MELGGMIRRRMKSLTLGTLLWAIPLSCRFRFGFEIQSIMGQYSARRCHGQNSGGKGLGILAGRVDIELADWEISEGSNSEEFRGPFAQIPL